MTKGYKLAIGCAAGGLVVGTLAVVLLGTHLGDSLTIRDWGNLPFDSLQWKTAKIWNDPDCVRGQMVRALLRDFKLEGMTRREVVDLLGPPDSTKEPYPDRSGVSLDAGVFEYFLGNRVSFAIDDDLLQIRFGPNGKVRSWNITTD